MKRKLGEILMEIGAITPNQLDSALEYQQRFKEKIRLGSALINMGFITDEKLSEVLSRYLNIPMVSLAVEFISSDIVRLVPCDVAEKFEVMPFKIFEENRKKILGLAMADPTNLEPIDIIQFSTSLNIRPFVAYPSDIHNAIQRYYHGIYSEGISYVGKTPQPGQDGKIKIITQGNEITWHGGSRLSESPESKVPSGPSSAPRDSRVSTSSTQGENTEMMGEMIKLLRESNALMKVLVKKGIISEEELNQELVKEAGSQKVSDPKK